MNNCVPLVLGYVVDVVLKDYLLNAEALADEWDSSVGDLLRLGVRSVPSQVLNLILGSECLAKFGSEILRTTPGLISVSRTLLLCECREYDRPCWCSEPAWLLDLDPQLHPHGLMLPETDQKGRAIGLWIFRNSKDENYFRLRDRKREAVL